MVQVHFCTIITVQQQVRIALRPGDQGESLLIRSLTLTRLQMGSRFVLMCVCVCVYLSSEGLKSPKIERSHSHLHVLCYDAHTEIQAHIYQEQCV